MSYPVWILLFVANSLFFLWVLRWGGAEWLEDWRFSLFFEWVPAFFWSAEQIKFYALLCWIGHLFWFLGGLFMPELRFYG